MTGLGFGEASPLAFPAFPSAPPPLLLRSPLRSSPSRCGGSVRHSKAGGADLRIFVAGESTGCCNLAFLTKVVTQCSVSLVSG